MPGKDPPAVKLTYQDYCRIPEDGQRHEVLDGEHLVNPAPTPGHQGVLGRLYVQLFHAIEEAGLGLVFPAPTDLHLSEVDILQPDIMVILSEHRHIVTRTKVKGVPDLVVEVLSRSTGKQDRTRKKRRFLEAGVLDRGSGRARRGTLCPGKWGLPPGRSMCRGARAEGHRRDPHRRDANLVGRGRRGHRI